jgi:thiamine-phosphate pyrophosphorylase
VKLPDPPLLLVTDRKQARGDIIDIASAALAAGCRWVSLREKDLSQEQQQALLEKLLAAAKPYAATVTLHGDPAIAHEAGAHGVHIEAGRDTAAARRLLGNDALIGLSVHSFGEARATDPAIVDYVIAGPAFLTDSKPAHGPQLVPDGLAAIVAATSIPVIAIGGIFPRNVAECRRAGAAGVAVMGGVMRATDPKTEIGGLVAAIKP